MLGGAPGAGTALIPAIADGKRVIISTGTKNLQEQLYNEDIPFLQKYLARPLRVVYMKGRNNYLCRQKLYEAEKRPILSGLAEIEDFRTIREWDHTTETGDRAELKQLPSDPAGVLQIATLNVSPGQPTPTNLP